MPSPLGSSAGLREIVDWLIGFLTANGLDPKVDEFRPSGD